MYGTDELYSEGISYYSNLVGILPCDFTSLYLVCNAVLYDVMLCNIVCVYRHCEMSNSHEMVKVFGRLSRDIPVRIHNASLLHSAAR